MSETNAGNPVIKLMYWLEQATAVLGFARGKVEAVSQSDE